MCLGDCEQISEQARGNEKEGKKGDHVKKSVCMRGEKYTCACPWSGGGTQVHTQCPLQYLGTTEGLGTGHRTGGKEHTCLSVWVHEKGHGCGRERELKGRREQASLSTSKGRSSGRGCMMKPRG